MSNYHRIHCVEQGFEVHIEKHANSRIATGDHVDHSFFEKKRRQNRRLPGIHIAKTVKGFNFFLDISLTHEHSFFTFSSDSSGSCYSSWFCLGQTLLPHQGYNLNKIHDTNYVMPMYKTFLSGTCHVQPFRWEIDQGDALFEGFALLSGPRKQQRLVNLEPCKPPIINSWLFIDFWSIY